MEWKQLGYKILKGAISGAAAALAVVQVADIPHDKLASVMVSAAIVGGFHGIANAIEQKAGI